MTTNLRPDQVEQLAQVLAEHVYVPSGLRGVSRCACGIQFHGMPADHRAHVAASVAATVAALVTEAEVHAATAWAVHDEHVENMNRLRLHDMAVANDRERAMRERVEAVLADRRSVYGAGTQVEALSRNVRAAMAAVSDV